jgi:zinc and cadmium transporter
VENLAIAMHVLGWILLSGLLMSAIALVGASALLLRESTLQRVITPMVAFAAGSLLGGAFFHMIPASIEEMGVEGPVFAWILAGFSLFYAVEQFLHWHHCHREYSDCHEPQRYLILFGDGLHNFVGGIAVAGAFMIDIRLGMTAWLVAAAHEVPQELGDFAVLVHGGWSRKKALVYNFFSALTFPLGGVLAYAASFRFDVSFLVPFAAGNFIYIAASDLVPAVNKQRELGPSFVHFFSLLVGMAVLLLFRHGGGHLH